LTVLFKNGKILLRKYIKNLSKTTIPVAIDKRAITIKREQSRKKAMIKIKNTEIKTKETNQK
jgi:hypothetical protein